MEFRVGDECFCKMSISVDEVARESSQETPTSVETGSMKTGLFSAIE